MYCAIYARMPKDTVHFIKGKELFLDKKYLKLNTYKMMFFYKIIFVNGLHEIVFSGTFFVGGRLWNFYLLNVPFYQ